MILALSSGDILTAGFWLVLYASMALAVTLGLVLAYHWFAHAHNITMSFVAACVYVGVSSVLISMMFTALMLLA